MANSFTITGASFPQLENSLPYFFIAILAAAFMLNFSQSNRFVLRGFFARISYRRLIISVIVARLLLAVFHTAGQYYVWSVGSISRFLLPPYQPAGYFISYSWGHFWLNVFLSFCGAALFYLFLAGLRRVKPHFFEKEEIQAGVLGILIVGWPLAAVYAPLVFALSAVAAFFNQLVFKNSRTAIGIIFLAAALLTIAFGRPILAIFNLAGLYV